MGKICAIIISYNIGERIKRCITAIENQVDQVLIIDNGSNAETINQLRKVESEKIKVIYNKSNIGIAKALNIGVEYSIKNNFYWTLTLDHDSVADKNMIFNMINTYNALTLSDKEKVVSIFPRVVEETFNDDKNFYVNEGYIYTSHGITSGNLIKNEVFNKIGLFKEEFFIDYVDNEFCFRISKNNFKMITVNNAILLHNLGEPEKIKTPFGKFTTTNHSAIRRYYITRNRFQTWREYEDIIPNFIKEDRRVFIKENIKIILFEKDKINKFKMIYKGYKDYKACNFGKLEE